MAKIEMEKRKYKLTFTEKILGSSPMSDDIYSRFILDEWKKKHPEEYDQAAADDELSMIENDNGASEMKLTGFRKDEEGVYLLNYQIKGNFKENSNILKDALNIKNLRSKIVKFVHVFPRHLWLKEKVDGIYERPIQVMTMQGPRVGLAASEYVDSGVSIEIEVSIVPNKQGVDWNVVEALLSHGEVNGISQWRSAYFGTYTWEHIA